MDNDNNPCGGGATWQSPIAQVQSQDASRASMMKSSHLGYPPIVQEPCSSNQKMMANPLFQTTNFNVYNSSLSPMGTPFFTLLSGPPSFSQYDPQRVLSSKPLNPSGKAHVNNTSSGVGPTHREASFGSPKLQSQNIDNHYQKSKIENSPVAPIKTLASDSGNRVSSLHDLMQARRVSDPSLEPVKAANYHTSHGIAQLHGFSSPKAIQSSRPTPAQSGKLPSSSIPPQLSPVASGSQRVFCLYASGDLFLSNSGLLGVVCSCHGYHMSIAKFLEHSGLRDVNPGDAVHMDSGEPIVQWRKVYFSKFGIKIPDDQCGWNWPEEFSAAADALKSRQRVPNMTNSNQSNSVGPSRAFAASRQPLKGMVFPDGHHSTHNLGHELKRNNHENCKSPNGFAEISQSNAHSGAVKKFVEQPVSRLSNSKLAGGTDNAFKPCPTYIDPIYKTKSPFTSQQSLHNLISLGKGSDESKSSRNADTLEKTRVSSNIELRLGQPSEQSQTLGNLNMAAFSADVRRVGHPLESLSSKPLIYNAAGTNRSTEGSKQVVSCAAQAAKSTTDGHNRLGFSTLGFGAYSTKMPLQPEKLKGDAIAGSANSLLFSHLGSPKDKIHTKESHNGAEDHHVMSKQQYDESRISMLGSKNSRCNTDNSTKVNFGSSDVKFMGHLSSSFGLRKTNHDQNSPVQIYSDTPVDHGGFRAVNSQPISPRPPLISGAPSMLFSSIMNSSPNMTSTMPNEVANRVIYGDAEKPAVISVSRETSYQIRESKVQGNLLGDPYQSGHPLARIGISEDICSYSRHGNCCRDTSCAHVPDKCHCSVQKNSTIQNSNLDGKSYLSAFGEPSQIRASILSASNSDKGCTLHDRQLSLGKIGETMKPNLKKVEFSAFQWKDVPSKMPETCHAPCRDQTAMLLEERIAVNDKTTDATDKCFYQPARKADCMKEQVMSNISSRCSAPAQTQASVKISNGDSCTDDAQNTDCAKNFAVDEGSGNQKHWSSDDALDSGCNSGSDGFACETDSINVKGSKAVSGRSTRSLIDELRVIDSSRLKKVQNQVHSRLPMRDNTSFTRSVEKDVKLGKRKREKKFKHLGTRFPASPVSSMSTGSSGQSSESMEDVNKLDKSRKELLCKKPRRVYDDFPENPESSCGKKPWLDLDFSKRKHVRKQVSFKRITRPVVCGRYGVISNGDTSKPAKIFSLGKILKTAKRCAPAAKKVVKKSPAKSLKKTIIRETNRRSGSTSNLKEDKCHIGLGATVFSDDDPLETSEDTDTTYCPRMPKDANASCRNEGSHGIPDSNLGTKTRRKNKEIRIRSIYELISEGKDSGLITTSKNVDSINQDNLKNGVNGNKFHEVKTISRSPEEPTCKATPDVNSFCHVCGSLNSDEMNCLLECNRCLIKVHQACYGISKVPKSYWYCRPCKENATNMVCVLCGFEGGLMTRAVQSSNIVRSLLNAWNVVTKSQENADAPSQNQVDIEAPPSTISEQLKASSATSTMVKNLSDHVDDTMVRNSVTAGFFDTTVKQWVHMVCGLWTPGTRCPNVDTMSTFDVSGARCSKGNVVCSMCKRPGGCCIRCRVMDCAIHFHPWCAHQKGLLQSELEGSDNEKVGFYGRCEHHATEDHNIHKTHSQSIQVASLHEQETCARTEGYKGRKLEGFRHDSQQNSRDAGGCLVRQEQVDAWNHINQLALKKRIQRTSQPVQDVEYDFRKEYARYKQSKGWKHLVVYKSGIHALGLYTSVFISQNVMVVEYVGEIVGQRVADRRETEYQSGKQLQYKNACYFFKIDKEHIIDATRKGGIARFVNHSCQPNCVAKVITVRGEKKVVFFALRDIYPGEEITYDYHFNNEDEGKKILCSCNSKNCRRYLN
uniref:Post-SET domain-containing protein n=1 Tax=Tanacetum cinerariifolium TaxID=118510 RepID=A0A6L2LMR9_TANCI|nr:post-SET domain-containing protein [Tanacetum cinerariifolium]